MEAHILANGRKSARGRINNRPKSEVKIKYKRTLPQFHNKLLQVLAKLNPRWTESRENMDPEFKSKLKANHISPATYRRILLNETIVTLDELNIIAKIIGVNVKELV